ncbi:YraN family protein [Pseudoalteromonas xiamenensis]
MKKWLGWFANSTEKGCYYELQAEQFLIRQGLTPVARNFRCRFGEIDLIMKLGETIVFVEVKYRAEKQFGGAIHSLTPQKMKRIRRTIAFYCQSNHLSQRALRIDFVAIDGEQEFHWIKNIY